MIKIDTRVKQETLNRILADAKNQKRSKCAVIRNIIEQHYDDIDKLKGWAVMDGINTPVNQFLCDHEYNLVPENESKYSPAVKECWKCKFRP